MSVNESSANALGAVCRKYGYSGQKKLDKTDAKVI